MQAFKSTFISLYLLFIVIISIHSLIMLYVTDFNLIWLGTLLTTLPFLSFLIYVTCNQKVARTSTHLPFISITVFIGLLISFAGFLLGRPISLLAYDTLGLFASIFACILYAIYLLWYSALPKQSNPQLKLGDELSDFELVDLDNKPVSSDSFKGQAHLMLFYRGNWCPFCVAQVKELVADYQKLEALGVSLSFISPQPQLYSAQLAKKLKAPVRFFVDVNNLAAKQLGIDIAYGLPKGLEALGYDSDTVIPTVLITDAKGKIIYLNIAENYRTRPTIKEYVRALEGNPSSTMF